MDEFIMNINDVTLIGKQMNLVSIDEDIKFINSDDGDGGVVYTVPFLEKHSIEDIKTALIECSKQDPNSLHVLLEEVETGFQAIIDLWNLLNLN